ncbi:MAG TPA: aspartate-semialdehyde dehydrogenase [Candidatus Cloacimonadota bacterium]|jgi:aspartate-semialdehyde dehydrogenase|nr:aspartate-semialdehyde dehydrogenase [Candidatus Cloacimonadota bacterium]HOF59067.1 aspartate-semialdehyde dehydrogenase [Candidatus Cloacimonadota bacterium]HOR58133.1 aspartate-semialdehyde dehydrogenase [Candidatus Cloacimonadota bacterium]HPL22808.1 aspartate-semialdehyde dehydrogenase [Candidatus Cloacimonadota bacterium]HQL13047.1 aspartate-semialdehyde dehydrogenase [Candidatus Cloacimonadota bacterium]
MKIAIVGATGEVGRMMLTCLQEYKVPVNDLSLFASSRSAGEQLFYEDRPITVRELDENALTEPYDYVLFSAGGSVSKTFAPIAARAGSVVIDNSSAFRMEPEIPLVVPEINGDLLETYKGIIANPNCSTIQMVLPLAVLDKLFGLNKVVVSTYQSVSGSGHQGILTLEEQRAGSADKGVYPQIIDLNVIPQIGIILDSGYSQEEEKMHLETRKILRKENIAVCATTVRVPVLYGHSESVYAEFDMPVDLALAAQALAESQSIDYYENSYLTPRELGSSDNSHVCRLRHGVDEHSVSFWNVAHNVRLGAASNAVRILIRHAVLAGKL